MAIKPYPPRHTIEDLGDALRITIPSQKQWFVVLFLGFWLMGWAFGEFTALQALFGAQGYAESSSFMIVWLIGWTLGGIYAVYILLWLVSGKEVVEISNQGIIINRVLLGFDLPKKEYSGEYIQDLRVSPVFRGDEVFGWTRRRRLYSMSGGPIAFDYGAKTIRFGGSIHEAEAKRIIAQIGRRFPQWR